MASYVITLKVLQPAQAFLKEVPIPVQNKLTYIMGRIVQGDKNVRFFKKIVGTDIWEFRISYNTKIYRLLAFWDTKHEVLIVATHGFIKKQQKTPINEIERAELIRKEYLLRHQK